MSDPVIETLDHIPNMPLDQRELAINRHAFIRLWTLATGTPNYDKDEWLRIERQLRTANLID